MIVDSGGFCWRLLVYGLAWLTMGCAATRITPVGDLGAIDRPISTVALAPQGGLFADLVGFDLTQGGCTIVDTGGTLTLLFMMHKSAAEMHEPEVIQALAQHGIQALLTIEKVAGQDRSLDAAQARVQTTSPAAMLGGVNWQNRWGRSSPVEAAHEIAGALVNQLCKPSDETQSGSHRDRKEMPAP